MTRGQGGPASSGMLASRRPRTYSNDGPTTAAAAPACVSGEGCRGARRAPRRL
jgi:hypothetical protein